MNAKNDRVPLPVAITADNITAHELIGLSVTVTDAPNPSMVGLSGRVVDETMSMITVATGGERPDRRKHIPKDGARLRFSHADGSGTIGTICGSGIMKRPFERGR